MRETMTKLQAEILANNLTFQQVCDRVEESCTGSPLEKHGISVASFSEILKGIKKNRALNFENFKDPKLLSKWMNLSQIVLIKHSVL